VLPCNAHDPGVRLRDIAARTGVAERTAYGIVTERTEAGHVARHKDGRRNRCQIQAHPPPPKTGSRKPAIGEILALLAGADDERPHDSGRLDRGMPSPAPAPGHTRHGHRPAVRLR
jgi:hypothetical protein